MLLSIIEGSGSIARCCMLVQPQAREITPLVIVTPTGEQLGMFGDPGEYLPRGRFRDVATAPSLYQLWEVRIKVHPAANLRRRDILIIVESGCKGGTHWLPEGSSSVGVGGTPLPGPRI